ncbi:MAG: 3-dehydroquinate synthase [Bacillota bacterium]|nr:MAG: 3-dehydroquinate synthase [Bacillota bacterium]
MKRIPIETAKPYEVLVGGGILQSAGREIARVTKGKKAFIVSDDVVLPLYGGEVRAALIDAGFQVYTLAFEHGERHKTLATAEKILSTLCAAEITRSDVLVALGGGVVGDVCGFVAAIYLRGVSFVQIPTTLLAAVDSSVGGKTGVDLPAGKNLAGAFHQPSLVVCDTDVISNLPENLFSEGMAEAIKYGVIGDAAFFAALETGHADIETVVETSVRAKAAVVKKDEFDAGERMLLNFGHTFGHAAEKLSDFTVSHGEGVAMGMAFACRYAEKIGFAEEKNMQERLQATLARYRLPTECPFSGKELFSAMANDKKRAGQSLRLILPKKIGRAEIFPVSMETLKEVLSDL